jgi:hypothetical protein
MRSERREAFCNGCACCSISLRFRHWDGVLRPDDDAIRQTDEARQGKNRAAAKTYLL